MRIALLLILGLLSSCAHFDPKKFREENLKLTAGTSDSSREVYQKLFIKMEACYPRNKSEFKEEGIFGAYESNDNKGTIYFGVRDLPSSDVLIHLIEIVQEGSGSRVFLYSKDDMFRTSAELSQNLLKWLQNEKGQCRGNGLIGKFWRDV